MRTISVKLLVLVCGSFALLSAQSDGSSDPFGGDPFGGLSVDSTLPPLSDTTAVPSGGDPFGTSSESGSANPVDQVPMQNNLNQTTNLFADVESSSLDANVQNAVIEGIQITADKGSTPEEKIVSGYFIFRDKPSHYFYDVNLRQKKITFEFQDTKASAAPVPSVAEAPIKGFTIVSDRIDVNKTVKGLNPEFHNVIRVVFDLEGVPEIKVNDEYSIITFSFKWTNNPALISKYTMKDPTKKIVWWSVGVVGAAGLGGAAAWFFTKPEPAKPLEDLSIADLPLRSK
jgi:hypothetical protein